MLKGPFHLLVGRFRATGSLATLATEKKADLVVIERGKAQELLGMLRTRTYDIIRKAHCPVLSYSSEQVGAKASTSEEHSQAMAVSVS